MRRFACPRAEFSESRLSFLTSVDALSVGATASFARLRQRPTPALRRWRTSAVGPGARPRKCFRRRRAENHSWPAGLPIGAAQSLLRPNCRWLSNFHFRRRPVDFRLHVVLHLRWAGDCLRAREFWIGPPYKFRPIREIATAEGTRRRANANSRLPGRLGVTLRVARSSSLRNSLRLAPSAIVPRRRAACKSIITAPA